jgi:enamine deaminase RidA (YjgF/YER057c/UK114 family)
LSSREISLVTLVLTRFLQACILTKYLDRVERKKTMTESSGAKGQVDFIHPGGLHRNPAFTNVVVVTGPAKTIYVGGQNAVDASGAIVGKGDLKKQTEQILTNMQIALAAAGAGLEHVVRWTLYVVEGQPLREGFEVFQRVWGDRPNPPAISMAFVAGLANPDFLAEMDAIAVVPE